MIGVVKGWPDQVVHRGIKNDKAFGLAILDIHNARNHHTGIASNQAARFERDVTAKVTDGFTHHLAIGIGQGRGFALIGNAKPATKIKIADIDAFGPKLFDQIGKTGEGFAEGCKIGQL